jgi:peptidoglycan hydrolase-like protein with peptidoglycan-binding domain/phosphodiesterase/alkaline phosphatase D-like protein
LYGLTLTLFGPYKMQKLKATAAFLAIIGMLFLNISPVFALGELPPVEPPPTVQTPPPVQTPTPPPVETPPVVVTPPADTAPPVISGVASLSLGTTEATLVWTTDELAVSHLEYGTTTSYGTQPTLDASALLAHTAILTGLSANTTYYYCIHATDLSGNTANACSYSFTTAANPVIVDTTPPNITLVTVTPIATNSATVNFTTSEVANAEVEYGTTTGYGSITPLDTNLALTHSVTLSNLTANTLYHYRIKTSDEIGNQTIGSDETFTTQALSANVNVQISDTTPPVVSEAGSISVGTTTATLGWTTNELATSTLEYGTTTGYGTQATISLSALLAHTTTLTGLQSGTTYYYCIHATDLTGNVTNSCGHSFATESVSAPADTTPPIISVIAAAPITTSGATVTWTTNEMANSQINYGTTASYGLISNLDPILGLTHSIVLGNLLSGTTYHYQVRSADDAGNVALSSDQTFTTQTGSTSISIVTPSDTTPPVVSDAGSISIGTTNVTLGWTTNELAISTLEYGTTQSYGTQPTINITALLTHTATLTGLTSGTTYYYCVHATDLAGNTTNSCGHSFTTESVSAPADTTAPVISLVASAPITSNGATITWTTNELANSQVQYGTTTSYGSTTTLDPILTLTHSSDITGLSANTTYHYRVKSFDDAGNVALGFDQTFTTSATPQVQLQTSSVNISTIETTSITTSGTTITWKTDLPSDSQVEYGNSENLGTLTVLDTTMNTNHSVTLTGLSQNTNYIFNVKSKPVGASNQTVSANQEFDTLAQEIPVVTPANILLVSSSSITTTGATINWTTDKNTTSQVEYGISTSYGESTSLNQAMQTSHQISLADLLPATTYHYRVKSTDEVSNITYSEDYTFSTLAPAQTVNAPLAITTLAIGGYDNESVALVWNADSSQADVAAKYDIRYFTAPINDGNFTSAIPAQTTPILYTDLSPSGTQRSFIIPGLDLDITYYFAIKSHFQGSDYSPISNVVSIRTTKGVSVSNETAVVSSPSGGGDSISGRGSSGGGGGSGGWTNVNQEYGILSGGTSSGSFEPTLVKADPADSQIIFTWNNPGESNFVRTVVVRKDESYPNSPADGQTVYEGRAETFTDTNVQNGTTYYYAVYSYNHAKIYSSGVMISLAPSAQNKEDIFNESGINNSTLAADHFIKVFKKGDKDIEIEHLQEILSADGDSYQEKYVTGYFGDLTQIALKNFQLKHRLAQTGITDAATQKELNTIAGSETRLDVPKDYAVFTTNMKLGDQNDAVSALQAYLTYEGSLANNNDNGVFGKSTKAAVMTFQKKYGINPVSGYVGYKTRHKMKQLAGL